MITPLPSVRALGRGDHLPRIVTDPPGPAARALGARIARAEAPGINTVYHGEPGLPWWAARGANVLDVDGNRFVDLTAGFGVAAVGHRHPRVVAAVRAQAGRLVHGLGDVAGHPGRVALAERLAALAPVDDARVYFAISGADAVEIALKTARLATGRQAFLAFTPAYHGLTLGALAASSREGFRAPFAAHLTPHFHRLPFACALAEVAARLRAEPTAAVLVEPLVGREGVLLPPAGWLAGLAACCRTHGALLAVDEIFTGFGRTGAWFVCEEEGVRPDLLICGKALGGGLPLAAVVGQDRHLAAWETRGEALHTATFVAHPLATAAALAALEVLERERLPERARELGQRLLGQLADWPTRFPGVVTAVRGRGLLVGVELANASQAAELVRGAQARGVLLLAGGPEGRVAQLCPPLVITPRQLDDAVSRLAAVLSARTIAPR